MDAEVDVLIAGAGAAGMTAALVCALNGLDVLLCEKSSQVGGTTRDLRRHDLGAGHEAGASKPASRTIFPRRGAISTRSSVRRPTAAARRIWRPAPSSSTISPRNSEVKFSLYARHPDYLSNRPGTTLAGRALAPLPFDGRLLGADFALLRPPIGEFMALGGMMIGRDDIEPLSRPFESAGELPPRAFAACGGTPPTACATAAARGC